MAKRLAQQKQQTELSEIMRQIIENKNGKKFRVCVIGGSKISWDVALDYKRKKIIIDTIGLRDLLSQVSYTTGGFSLSVDSPTKFIKAFLNNLSMSTSIRKYYPSTQNKVIQYHLTPFCCSRQSQIITNKNSKQIESVKSVFLACTVCMAVYCKKHGKNLKRCQRCDMVFDPPYLKNDVEYIQPYYK